MYFRYSLLYIKLCNIWHNMAFFILGMLIFFALLVLLLVIAVIVWRPREAGIYPMKHWKPTYRSLGEPPNVPTYMRYDSEHWPEKGGHGDGWVNVLNTEFPNDKTDMFYLKLNVLIIQSEIWFLYVLLET